MPCHRSRPRRIRPSAALLALFAAPALLLTSTSRAHDPAAGPATRPAAPQSTGEARALAGGTIHFIPPDRWAEAANAATDRSAAFVWQDHDAILAVEVLPADAKITAAAAGKIVQSLRLTRQQRREQVVLAPTVEKDPRFLLRIHEKFRSGDRTADQLHLYRQVGPRVVMVTVKATTESEDDLKGACKAGEDAAVSATFGRGK